MGLFTLSEEEYSLVVFSTRFGPYTVVTDLQVLLQEFLETSFSNQVYEQLEVGVGQSVCMKLGHLELLVLVSTFP